jgi:hypothetical protein
MEDLPQILLEIFDTNRVFARNGTAHPLQSNVSLAEALELYTAVRNLRPEFSVEIGLAHGVSALAILAPIAANGTGYHYLIDPFQSNYGYCGETMIQRAGYHDLHTFLERFPEEALPAAARCLKKIPGAGRFLNSNILLPWSTFRVGNLVFLRKLSDDHRDWRCHQRF